MIVIEDGATIVVKLPSGQLVQLRDIRVQSIEMSAGASYGRRAALGGFDATMTVRAMDVGYLDSGSDPRLRDAVNELAQAIGEEPTPEPAQGFKPIAQHPVAERVRQLFPDKPLDSMRMTEEQWSDLKTRRGLR